MSAGDLMSFSLQHISKWASFTRAPSSLICLMDPFPQWHVSSLCSRGAHLHTLQTKHCGWYVRPSAETTSPEIKSPQLSHFVPYRRW